MHPIIREIESPYMRKDLPYFRPGDTITLSVKIVEGDKERLQDYTGVVIARRGGGMRETVTVRRTSFGVGMERIFPLHSPRIDSIKVKRRCRVRRAKLYYLRQLSGKKARLAERRVTPDKLAREEQTGYQAYRNQLAIEEERLEALRKAEEEAKAKAEAEAQAAAEAEAKAKAEEEAKAEAEAEAEAKAAEEANAPAPEASAEEAPADETPAAEDEKKE